MEDHNSSFDYDNMMGYYDDRNQEYDYSSYLGKALFADSVVTYIVISSGVPLCAVAVYVLYSLVRHGGAPALVYVFNLLISDIVQICSLIVIISPLPHLWILYLVFSMIHSFCVVARVAFMVCIALERYLLVSRPQCFCFKRPTRTSVVVSVLVWMLGPVVFVGAIFALAFAFVSSPVLGLIIIGFLVLLPVPLFIFCLAATLRALSACRLPAEEKRRVVAVLVLVLLIYILPFLPAFVTLLKYTGVFFINLASILVTLSGMVYTSSFGTWDYDYSSYSVKLYLMDTVVNSIIVSSGVPLCAVAVYVLYSLVRLDGAPALVYVVNLLISDIVQICCLYVIIRPSDDLWKIYLLLHHIHSFFVVVSIAFMVCIAFERYLLVSRPLCICSKGSTRTLVVSVLVWIFCPVVYVGTFFALASSPVLGLIIIGFLVLLPIPLFIFCLAATLKALSACRLPADEKRRIVAVLVLVLLIYTLFFLPAVTLLADRGSVFYKLASILVRLNPLADLVLYVFMRKGAVDKLLASVCCCKMNGGDSSIPSA
ncbi:uncharacterized protein V6R79_017221 [Siganus canaliculatus]